MKIEDAIHKMKFMKNGYQKLIDENCSEGTVVGTDVTGTWKSNTPLTEVYQAHIDACNLAIEALEKQIPKPTRITKSSNRCGRCGRQLSGIGNIHPKRNYCTGCGQAIDWMIGRNEE